MSSQVQDELLSVPQKKLTRPVVAAKDRFWLKFTPDTISDISDKFEDIRFRCSIPSKNSVLKTFDLVLPLKLRFYDRAGKLVLHNGIAIKPHSLDRIFQSVCVTVNGQKTYSYPLEKAYHQWVSPSVSYYKKNSGSMLPILVGSDVAIEDINKSFQERARDFKLKRVIDDSATNVHAGAKRDVCYRVNLHIKLDCSTLSGFFRGPHANANTTIPYAYQLDIVLKYAKNASRRDEGDVGNQQGQHFWKHIFEIEQDISKLPCEPKGFELPTTVVPRVVEILLFLS